MEPISQEFENYLISNAHKLSQQDPSASAQLRQFFQHKDDVEKSVKDCDFEAPAETFEMIQSKTPPSLSDWHVGFIDDWQTDRNVWNVYAITMIKTDKYTSNQRKIGRR